MAVVKQKFAAISGSLQSLESAVMRCADEKEFFTEEPPQSVSTFKRFDASGESNPYFGLKNKARALLEEINQLPLPKDTKPAFCKVPVFADYQQYAEYLREMEQKLTVLGNECQKHSKQIEDNKILIDQLKRLENLNIPLGELYDFEFIKTRFGYLPRENYERFEIYIGSIQSVAFLPSTLDKENVWGMYLTLRDSSAKNDKVFATLGFKRVRLPSSMDGLPADSIKELTIEAEQLKKKYEAAKQTYYNYAAEVLSELEECDQYLSMLAKAFEIKKKLLLVSEDNWVFYGWVNTALFKKLQDDLNTIGVEVNEQSIAADDVGEPPVVLKNLKIFRPFEQFVEMYGLPSYNEFDPTPFVAITYSLFFGMMFGDVGQGFVLALAGLAAKRFLKIKLGSILAIVGVFSMAFGVIFGSVFGDEEIIHGFKPMENVTTVLLTAVGIGVVMITICSLINIVNGIKQRNVEKYAFSANGIAGLMFYWSLLLILFDMLNFLDTGIPQSVVKIVLIISMLMIFARQPLSKLIEGKKDWKPERMGETFVENFFELFEILLSYITNTISFIRIGAFALSHASMMAVVFLIANQQSGFARVAIIIGGNILVMGLEGLVVCIQVLRLEFYELFSRFYEGDGRPVKEA